MVKIPKLLELLMRQRSKSEPGGFGVVDADAADTLRSPDGCWD
jgi:hypothetical protein